MPGPFGVELPDNLGSTAPSDTGETSDLAPDTGGTEISPDGASKSFDSESGKTTETPSQPLDLDKVERFRFQGREWTSKELRDAYMMRADYTRKTQELAETRKYSDNFDSDLRSVMKDPNLFAEFKRIYPKNYVAIAEEVLSRLSPNNQTNTNQPTNGLDSKAIDKLLEQRLSPVLDKVGEWEKAQHAAEVEKIGSWLDNQYERLSSKYPYANTEVITARADLAHRNGVKVDAQLLEKLFRTNNGEIETQWSKLQESKVNKQLKANNRARDMGTGGGVPGNAPKGAKTIKDATNAWLQDLGKA